MRLFALLALAALGLGRGCRRDSDDTVWADCIREADGGLGAPTCEDGLTVTCPENKPVPFCVYDPEEEIGRARCREFVEDLILPPFPTPTCE